MASLPPHSKRAIELRRELFARAALEAAGITPQHLQLAAKRTTEALDAEVVKVFGPGPDREISYAKPLVDHATRLRAANRIFKMIPGLDAPKEIHRTGGDLTVEIITLAPDGTKLAVRVNGATSWTTWLEHIPQILFSFGTLVTAIVTLYWIRKSNGTHSSRIDRLEEVIENQVKVIKAEKETLAFLKSQITKDKD